MKARVVSFAAHKKFKLLILEANFKAGKENRVHREMAETDLGGPKDRGH